MEYEVYKQMQTLRIRVEELWEESKKASGAWHMAWDSGYLI